MLQNRVSGELDFDDIPPRGVSKMEGGAVCLDCGRTFKTFGNANQHYKEKHLSVPGQRYNCHLCSATFSRVRHRKTHMGKVHNITKLLGKPVIPISDAVEDYYLTASDEQSAQNSEVARQTYYSQSGIS